MDGDEAGHAGAFFKDFTHAGARRLRRDHADVHELRWDDLIEVDVEAVGEHDRLPLAEVRLDVFQEDLALNLIRHREHDHVCLLDRFCVREHLQAGRFRFGLRGRTLIQADDDVDATVFQIESVGPALRAISKDCHRLATQPSKVRIGVVIDLRHHLVSRFSAFPLFAGYFCAQKRPPS